MLVSIDWINDFVELSDIKSEDIYIRIKVPFETNKGRRWVAQDFLKGAQDFGWSESYKSLIRSLIRVL